MQFERPAKELSDDEIGAEMTALEYKWDNFHRGFDGHGGSPGEWMFERMDELETERRRRETTAHQQCTKQER